MKKRDILSVIFIAIVLCILVAMIVQMFPLIKDLFESHGDETEIVDQIASFGWRGVPALIGLSALQVVVPVIPAPAVGVLAGLSYGVYWGPVIFLSGVALGNLFVVFSVRRLHNLIRSKRKKDPKRKKALSKERLEKIKRPEIAAFFLVLMPFVSTVGPYLFAETKVKLGRYIIAVIAGSIPSTIVYVFLGDRISRGNYTIAIIIGAIVIVALVFILLFRKKIMDKIMAESDT